MFNETRPELMGIAIVWIVFFHMTIEVTNPLLAIVKKFENNGVDIFLLLSGMGFVYSWNKCGEKMGAFYERRLLRVIPLTIVCLTPWYIYNAIIMRKITLRIVLDVVSLSFWIDGNNPGWYIAEYLFLTLIFPIIYYFLRKKRC